MSGWDAVGWIVFAASFAGWFVVGWVLAELVHRAGRKLQKDHATAAEWADREPWGTRPSWTQVGALEFVRYGRTPMGGARWELERVIFEDTPGGRLAAKRFQMEENVTGPKVLHTRDQGRR